MKFMIIKGKKYILKRLIHNKGTDKFYLTPFNEEEYNKIVSEIVSKIKHLVNPEKVLQQALSSLEYEEILRINNSLKHGAKSKASEGCYQILIGKNIDLDIVS